MGFFTGLFVVCAACTLAVIAIDSLSEIERERRDKMESNYRQFIYTRQEYLNKINQLKNSKLAELDQIERQRILNLIHNYERQVRNNRWTYFKQIRSEIDQHISEKRTQLNNINNIINQLNEAKRKSELTAIRKTSLENYNLSLNETKYKYKAYIDYLIKYKENFRAVVDNIDVDMPKPFEIVLPENIPYIGKLIFIKKTELKGFGIINVDDFIGFDYICTDLDLAKDMDDEAQLPVFVYNYDSSNHIFEISIARGILKYTISSAQRIALEAKVDRCEPNRIYLKYRNIDFFMYKKNLENPRRTPPRGSELRVYPLKWDYRFNYPVEVTEKYEQSIKSTQFKSIPLVLSNQQLYELNENISKYKIDTSYDEWKIGPSDGYFENNNYLKMQLGSKLVLLLELVIDIDNKTYLKYLKLLDESNIFKAEDIYATINTTLKGITNEEFSEFNDEDYLNLYDLTTYLKNEFKYQKLMINNREGTRYFYVWTQLLDAYLNQVSKSDNNLINCNIDTLETVNFDRFSKMKLLKYSLKNSDEIKERIKEIKNTFGYTEFFYETDEGERIPVEFNSTGEFLTLIQANSNDSLANLSSINIYKKDTNYPVLQQKRALMSFREGELLNLKLKEYIINSKNVEFTDNDFNNFKFFNSEILKNPAQKKSVKNALSEKYFYMIQGPPGTGKTTVIKEIICQHLNNYPKDNILVISQTNVAVDNVLERLINMDNDSFDSSSMIRCGNENKISDNVKDISFSKKYSDYINNIKITDVQKQHNKAYRDKWIKDIVENHKAEGILGEILLSNHRIIGATCVGLANRRIGLKDVKFDLVLIDEAGKALPGELLIPINRARKVILIGDHKQLPPTIDEKLSNITADIGEVENFEDTRNELFKESFFKRLYENCPESNKTMLNTQFRMPFVIGQLISDLFYDKELLNGSSTNTKTPIFFDNHMNFIDMSYDRTYKIDKSFKGNVNQSEIKIIKNLIAKIRKEHSNKIAVITPYKAQKRYLINNLKSFEEVYVDTVDGFQGDEADIAIFATTRSYGKTDFFSDFARINVALSRTIKELIIIGSMKYFKSYEETHPLFELAKQIELKGNVINGKTLFGGKVNE